MGKRKITCYCDNEIEIEVPVAIDLEKEPETERKILDGSFLSFTCNQCGKVLKPEFPIRIFDKKNRIEIFLLPELERGAFSNGKAKYELEDAERGRVVIGYPELVEKLKIARSSLDDRVIEIMKFYLLEKAGADDSVQAYFYEKLSESIEFHIHGMREGEVGVSKVPFRIYEQIEGELDDKVTDELFAPIVEPPYVSIQKTYREAAE